MGGERETVAKAHIRSFAMSSIKIGSVRIHENEKGEVNFHADAQGLRVACPVATWFSAWERISQTPGTWTFVDKKAKTAVVVVTKMENGILDATIEVSALTIGDTFDKLRSFTAG